MKVIAGQSLFDIAVQEDGAVESVFEWAMLNGKSVTDILTAGEELTNPFSRLRDKELSAYFAGIQKKVATGTISNQFDGIIKRKGIGSMIIEQTFIVG